MNDTPTPRTDAAAWPETDLVEGNFARQLESELAAVTEQRNEAQDGWHDEITKGLSELRRAESIYTKAQERAEKAEEQRDRLKEAMQEMWPFIEEDDYPAYNASSFTAAIKKYKVALQSLNQNANLSDRHE